MKKILIFLIMVGFLGAWASTARADQVAVSFRVGSSGHSDRDHRDQGRRDGHDWRYWHDHPYHNQGHFSFGYYYYYPYETTVIETYPVSNTQKILYNQEKLGISDIIVLSKAGVSDDAIIDKIAKTGSIFNLSVEEVEALKREGVSNRVVNFMLDTSKKR